MNDDQMDELLRDGVRDYNEPGAVPREEMWKRIAAARARSSGVARRPSPWVWPSAAAAAAVLLAAGVLIGRRMDRPAIVPQSVATTQAPAATRPDSVTMPVAKDSTSDAITKLHEATRATDQRTRALASSDDRPTPNTQHPTPTDNLAYRLVVLQHLAGTEAMITSFRTSAKHGQMDAQMVSWSRELLSTTRMLAASPAAQDPVMKRLLGDLDLVIAQIVQYSARGTNDPEELDLIEQSINKRGVITKLRGTLPGRNFSAGT
jgi:hypothetical protein